MPIMYAHTPSILISHIFKVNKKQSKHGTYICAKKRGYTHIRDNNCRSKQSCRSSLTQTSQIL